MGRVDDLLNMGKQLNQAEEKEKMSLLNKLGMNVQKYAEWKAINYSVPDSAVRNFLSFFEGKKNIVIVGDYDVDGICGTVIAYKGLRYKFPSANVSYRIPRRFSEGYGINRKIIDEIVAKYNPSDTTIVTVDNGISAKETLEYAKSLGFTVVITDHHRLDESLSAPDVDLIIDPAVEQIPNPFENRFYCGTGVVFKLFEKICEIGNRLEFQQLAGLATVADMVPLNKENWVIVRRVIDQIQSNTIIPAIKFLLDSDVADSPEHFTEADFGFGVAPKVNAMGRLLDCGADAAVEYFLNPTEEAAWKMTQNNQTRKKLTSEAGKIAKEYIAGNKMEQNYPMWVDLGAATAYVKNKYGLDYANIYPTWSGYSGSTEGILGLIAQHLSEAYARPALVCKWNNETGVYKGSARSYDENEFSIYAYLFSLRNELVGFGGHPGAGGFSISKENKESVFANVEQRETAKKIEYDLIINEQEKLTALAKAEDIVRPFGVGNKQPIVCVPVDVAEVKYIGSTQSTLSVPKSVNGVKTSILMLGGREAFDRILNSEPELSSVVFIGKVGWNCYQGQVSAQLSSDMVLSNGFCRER